MRPILARGVVLAVACSRPPAQPDIRTSQGRDLMLANQDPGADGKVDEKIRGLQQSLAKRPEQVANWLELGEAWIQKARDLQRPTLYANAGACASRAIALDPSNRAALELQGLVLMNDHRFAEASELMKRVVAASPEKPVAWGTLSDALLELGNIRGAVDAAQRMMDLKPNLPSYSRAAHLQWLHADLQPARESVRLAIDAGNGSMDREPRAWVIVQAAMMFWNEGDYDGALAGCDQALSELPNFAPALVCKGRILIGRGDGKAAEPLLAQAYKSIPLIETGWLLGDARESIGDEAGAQQVWAEIEKRGAADPRTLALFLATKNLDVQRAVQLAIDERKTRDDQYTEDVAAWALYRAGHISEALAASEKATALGTRDARLWYHRGAILLASGDTRGRELVQKALALNPSFDRTGAAEARSLAAEKKAQR
jgi:tetratricopeptide (TPR) repeat protein